MKPMIVKYNGNTFKTALCEGDDQTYVYRNGDEGFYVRKVLTDQTEFFNLVCAYMQGYEAMQKELRKLLGV